MKRYESPCIRIDIKYRKLAEMTEVNRERRSCCGIENSVGSDSEPLLRRSEADASVAKVEDGICKEEE
jgi:hypothetical protein